jgi:hypothetical protein
MHRAPSTAGGCNAEASRRYLLKVAPLIQRDSAFCSFSRAWSCAGRELWSPPCFACCSLDRLIDPDLCLRERIPEFVTNRLRKKGALHEPESRASAEAEDISPRRPNRLCV